jgi:hypothetical protein
MTGDMKEARDGVAALKEVESDTFTAFCEYAYTGSYRVPKVAVIFERSPQGSPSHHSTLSDPAWPVEEPPAEEAPVPEPEIPRDADEWMFSSKNSKKDKKKFLKWGEEAKPSEIKSRTDSDGTKEHNDHLWNKFRNLQFDSIPEESLDGTTEMEFKPLLFHCKLYVFAHMYLMASLMQLTLRKLHTALEDFHLDLESSDEVLEAVEFAFTNTERGDDHDDELRKLLVTYAASKTKILKQNLTFRTLLDAYGELGSDIVQVLG